MSSEELADRGRREYESTIVKAFKAAVDRMTLKEVAWLLKSTGPKVLDAIEGRDRKSVKLEWLVVLLVAAPEEVRHELVAAINKVAGYQPPKKRTPLSVEERLRIWERGVARLAPGIVTEIEEEIDQS